MSSSAKRIRLEPADTQETTIEKLCDDVLVEIFSYLSAEDFKCASLVCKHWNEVIGSSAAAMKKFKLKLKESELIGRQFRSSRKYQKIELEMLTTEDGPPSDQKSLENLDRFFELSQVKYFKIFAYNPAADPESAFVTSFTSTWKTFSIDAMKLTSALKQMKQIQELFIECPAGFRGSFTSTIDLPKLTKLAAKSTDASIFQWISASNVTEIDLIHQSSRAANVQHLASFLKLCKQITTLKLNSSFLRDLFGNGKWKDFNLKLSVLHIVGNAIPDATSLRELLMSQVPNLTSLVMRNVSIYLSESDKDSVAEAMSRLKNLKILSLDFRLGPAETFLRHLPELEQLTLDVVSDINSIARFNRKLTYLKIIIVRNSLDATLEFSELKHLCIGLDHSSNYLKVIRSSPKVETIKLRLSLRYFNDANICDEAIKAALQQPTLRHLKIENRFNDNLKIELLEEMFDLITSDYGNLKSFNLSTRIGFGWRSLEFLFPENRADWKADEQKMRFMETFSKK